MCVCVCVCVSERKSTHGAQNSSVSQLRTFTTGNKKAWRLTYFLTAARSWAPYCKCQSISAAAMPETQTAHEFRLHFRPQSREQKKKKKTQWDFYEAVNAFICLHLCSCLTGDADKQTLLQYAALYNEGSRQGRACRRNEFSPHKKVPPFFTRFLPPSNLAPYRGISGGA